MMKKIVIVVGSHHAGKSKTIRKYLKPKLGIRENDHKFTRRDPSGFILSQSLEEANRRVGDVIKKYSNYDILVLSARPEHENRSLLKDLKAKAQKDGYQVNEVFLSKSNDENVYDSMANKIFSLIDK